MIWRIFTLLLLRAKPGSAFVVEITRILQPLQARDTHRPQRAPGLGAAGGRVQAVVVGAAG